MSIIDREALAAAWPNLTEAARMIGISPATLSRDPDVNPVEAGRREKRFSPIEVLGRAALYKRRSLNEVAQELLDHAREQRPQLASAVESDIEEFFEQRPAQPTNKPAFFADLARVLPPALFEEVRTMYEAAEGHQPGEVISDLTDEETAAGA